MTTSCQAPSDRIENTGTHRSCPFLSIICSNLVHHPHQVRFHSLVDLILAFCLIERCFRISFDRTTAWKKQRRNLNVSGCSKIENIESSRNAHASVLDIWFVICGRSTPFRVVVETLAKGFFWKCNIIFVDFNLLRTSWLRTFLVRLSGFLVRKILFREIIEQCRQCNIRWIVNIDVEPFRFGSIAELTKCSQLPSIDVFVP